MGNAVKKGLYLIASLKSLTSENDTSINDELLERMSQESSDDESDEFIRAYVLEASLLYFLLGIIGLIIVTFMTKRKLLCQECLSGYFGLAVPVNFLELRARRKPFLAAFALVTMVLVDAVFAGDLAVLIGVKLPSYAKVFVKLLVASGIACLFYPLFAFIYMANFPSCIVGLLFHFCQMSLAVLMEIPVQDLTQRAMIKELLLRGIVYIVAGIYIFYWYIRQLFNLCSKRRKKIKAYSDIKFVKHLFKKKESDEDSGKVLILSDMNKNKCLKYIQDKFREKIYRRVPGFRYSLTVLTSSLIGFLAVTDLSINILYGLIKNIIDVLHFLRTYLISFKKDTMANIVALLVQAITNTESEEAEAESESGITVYDFLYSQSLIIVVGALLGGIVTYILALINISHLLTSYRENVMNLLKRKENVSHLAKTYSNVSVVKSGIQYGGYQIAYIVAGFSVQLFVFNVTFILLGEVIVLPIQFALASVMLKLLEIIAPIIVTLILIQLSQYLLIRFVFLEDRGKTLALDNRRGFFIMSYFVFFYNIFAGVFSCVKRIVMSTIISLLIIPRLDKSVFPRMFEARDSGFKTYICLLHLEALQSNPIVITFVTLLVKRRVVRFSFSEDGEAEALLHPKLPTKRQLALNRWFVAYTLIRNPSIIDERRKLGLIFCLQSAREYKDGKDVKDGVKNERETNV